MNKLNIKNDFISSLFSLLEIKLKFEIDRVIDQNSEKYNKQYPMFMYKGKKYTKTINSGYACINLHHSLEDKMDSIILNIDNTNKLKCCVAMLITVVLNVSTNESDVLTIMPDYTHPYLLNVQADSLPEVSEEHIKNIHSRYKKSFELLKAHILTLKLME